MTIRVHKGDLPDGVRFSGSVAIDTETLGLNPLRDRLCLVQLSGGDGTADVVQIAAGQTSAPRLTALLADRAVTKIFHFARFDIAVLQHTFGVMAEPIFCISVVPWSAPKIWRAKKKATMSVETLPARKK